MDTITISSPVLPDVLPADHQDLMNIFYRHWEALNLQVRANNQALDEDSNEYFFDRSVEGMLRIPTQAEIAAVMPAKVNAAVIFGNFNYQVCNGGFAQYDGNGYSSEVDTLEDLLLGASYLKIDGAFEVLQLVREFKELKDASENTDHRGYYDEDEDEGVNYDSLDNTYYETDREAMMQEVLDRFDEVCAAVVMKNARKAA